MANQRNKQITPLITMDEETERLKPLESEELLKIDDLFLDLKHKSVFFYNILSLYNKYIIKYIYNYLDNHLKDYIINYLDNKYSSILPGSWNVLESSPQDAYVKPGDVSPSVAEKILDFLNDKETTAEKIASKIEFPKERDVGTIVAQNILDKRKKLVDYLSDL